MEIELRGRVVRDALFRCLPVWPQGFEMRDDFFYLHDVGIFMMKVEQVHLVNEFMPGSDGKVFKVVKFAKDVTGRVENVLSLGKGLQALAAGDLCSELGTAFIPGLDQLRVDFNQTAQRLREAMRHSGERVGDRRRLVGDQVRRRGSLEADRTAGRLRRGNRSRPRGDHP
jgi:methyl-accepting chemotaxis protein